MFSRLCSGLGELVLDDGGFTSTISSQLDSSIYKHVCHLRTQVRQYGPTKCYGHSGSAISSWCLALSDRFRLLMVITVCVPLGSSFSPPEVVRVGSVKYLGTYPNCFPTCIHVSESKE